MVSYGVPRRGEPHEPRRPSWTRPRAPKRPPASSPDARSTAARIGSAEGYAPRREGVPRGHRRVGRAVCERHPRALVASGAEVGCARRRRASRCSRRSSTATPRSRGTRCSRASSATRDGQVTVYGIDDYGARTRAARPRSTRTSSARARCRRWGRSRPERWRTSSIAPRRSRSRSAASSCSCRARRRSRRSTCAGSRRCTRRAP